jgi:mono/diheme cytochrome c family protein
MKFRILFLTLTLLLTACNFTLAEDITPPPNYIPPTPLPTLVLYPQQKPNLANGQAIYAEKCAPCHGVTGLGDGEKGIQLSVTVRAFGLAEIARPASPAQYYTMVTRGNIERFMPPFNSLTDQERWDVISYALTLHTTPDQIEQGKKLFDKACAGCSTAYFEDQQTMSSLTEVELARIAKQGNDKVQAFGANFTDDELWAVATYLRTLSVDASLPTPPEAASVNPTPISAQGTPIGTTQAPAEGEATTVSEPGFGNVSGTIANETGAKLPSDLTVTLRGFDHDLNNPNTGPVEVLTLDGPVNPDGTYAFENVAIPLNRIFVAEVNESNITLKSEFAVVAAGAQSVAIPALTLYAATDDTSALVMDELQVILEYGTDAIQVYGIYSFHNPGSEIIVVPQSDTGGIPFIQFPEGASSTGFEPTQDSERFMPTDTGLAIPPSKNSYQLVAFASIPLADKLDFSQSFVMPINSITIFTPAGVKLENPQLTDLGVQTIQNLTYHVYQAPSAAAGDALAFAISGTPEDAAATTPPHNGLIIGAVAFGIGLILAGLWLYRRDKTLKREESPADEYDSPEEVMDAIIALDDLHSRKKISESAYQKKRAELKEILKGMM